MVPRGSSWQELGVDGRRREWVLDPLPALGEGERTAAESAAAGAGDGCCWEEAEEEEEEEEEDASERNKWVVEGMLGWSDQALDGP